MMFFAALGLPLAKSHKIPPLGPPRPRIIAKIPGVSALEGVARIRHRLVLTCTSENQLFFICRPRPHLRSIVAFAS